MRRQRALALLALAGAALGSVGAIALAVRDGSPIAEEAGERDRAKAPERPPELPLGGRKIFPDHRVVAFYGAPQDDALGALGIGTPRQATRRLRAQARQYRPGGRRILPALELITTVASGAPGRGGRYSYRQPRRVIRRYLAEARRGRTLLLLDIQPGRSDFMSEVRALRPFLGEPNVGVALDPEWHVGPGQVPGKQLGSVDASKINEVSAYLARIVRRKNLPEKLLLVHQFTDSMIENRRRLRHREGVPLAVSVDGFGTPAQKVDKYRFFTRGRSVRKAFKLFYREDTDLMSPREVLALRPRPDVVVYE